MHRNEPASEFWNRSLAWINKHCRGIFHLGIIHTFLTVTHNYPAMEQAPSGGWDWKAVIALSHLECSSHQHLPSFSATCQSSTAQKCPGPRRRMSQRNPESSLFFRLTKYGCDFFIFSKIFFLVLSFYWLDVIKALILCQIYCEYFLLFFSSFF